MAAAAYYGWAAASGRRAQVALLTLLAGLCFVAFCVVGLLWYSVPGATEELVFSAPYGREYRFDMQPWENIGLNESVVISITE